MEQTKVHDNFGKLPLHYASTKHDTINLEVIQQLVNAWPHAAYNYCPTILDESDGDTTTDSSDEDKENFDTD